MPVERDEQTKQALITSLRLLAASPKSGQEILSKLRAKGYPDRAIQNALQELAGQGVLDDRAYAKNLVGRLVHGKGSGRRQIDFELKRHGVPETLRKELLGTFTQSGEKERATELARLKWPQFENLDPRKARKKLFDHLIRKGYDFQTAHDVLNEISRNIPDEKSDLT